MRQAALALRSLPPPRLALRAVAAEAGGPDAAALARALRAMYVSLVCFWAPAPKHCDPGDYVLVSSTASRGSGGLGLAASGRVAGLQRVYEGDVLQLIEDGDGETDASLLLHWRLQCNLTVVQAALLQRQ